MIVEGGEVRIARRRTARRYQIDAVLGLVRLPGDQHPVTLDQRHPVHRVAGLKRRGESKIGCRHQAADGEAGRTRRPRGPRRSLLARRPGRPCRPLDTCQRPVRPVETVHGVFVHDPGEPARPAARPRQIGAPRPVDEPRDPLVPADPVAGRGRGRGHDVAIALFRVGRLGAQTTKKAARKPPHEILV